MRVAVQNWNLDNSNDSNDIFQNHRNLNVNAQKMRMLSEIASSIVEQATRLLYEGRGGVDVQQLTHTT